MEWRCEWCGKPHEEDDPPCDNCGHGSFEEAVVRRTGLSADRDEASTVVWVCTECGREHTRNSPPCSRCNNATLQREEKILGDDDLTAGPNATATESTAGTSGAEATTVWVCTECGREHPKHSPPCSRCGAPDLERETKRVGAGELASPSYVDLLTPRYALALVGVLALAAVFVLGATGVVNVPFLFPGEGLPEVSNVPGNATETGSGVSLAAVEDAYVETLNERRTEQGLDPLDRDGRLDEIVTVYNQQQINAEQRGATPNIERTEEVLREECERGGYVTRIVAVPVGDDGAAALGERLGADATTTFADGDVEASDLTRVGVDVHEIGGRLYLAQAFCA